MNTDYETICEVCLAEEALPSPCPGSFVTDTAIYTTDLDICKHCYMESNRVSKHIQAIFGGEIDAGHIWKTHFLAKDDESIN